MTDHEAIGRLVARYCRLLDDGRWDEFEDLWADDGELVLFDETTIGRHAIRERIETTQPPERRGRHFALNLDIEVDGDRATNDCDFMFWAKDREGKVKLQFIGRYADALVQTGATWRFARREIRFF